MGHRYQRKVFTLLTGLPLTRGHEALINFACSYTYASDIWEERPIVLLNTRDCEPISGEYRARALREKFGDRIKLVHYHGDVPQNPTESASEDEFWQFWKNLIQTKCGIEEDDIIITSELYGQKLAEVMNLTWIPFDVARQGNSISGTQIRQAPAVYYDDIMDTCREPFQFVTTFFGAESTGKSTITKNVQSHFGFPVHRAPEWAREYLELCGPETTPERMEQIELGQYALQRTAKAMVKSPFILQDTDLLSTIGYYRIFCEKEPASIRYLFEHSKSDLYIVMTSSIPFEKDVLRYGGDKRESTDQFWIDLLEEFGCNYVVIPEGTPEFQKEWAYYVIVSEWRKKTAPIREFVRT